MSPQQALAKIQLNPNEATRMDFMLAISYLHERLSEVEDKLSARSRAFIPPSPSEVTEYAKTIKFELDGQNFCDFYEARNWQVGKVKMNSWKACVRTWKTRRNETPAKPQARLPDNLRTDHGL
jgi:hypothetical protein